MEFKVPQFIDIEDKLFGSFTFAQAIYIAGAGGLSYMLWIIPLPSLLKLIKIPLIAAIIILAMALAFYPKEKLGKPFVEVLEAGFKFFFTQKKLYLWKRIPRIKKGEAEQITKQSTNTTAVELKLNSSASKLKDLAWTLGVKTINENQEN